MTAVYAETPAVEAWREIVDTHGLNVQVDVLAREVATAPPELTAAVEALPDAVWMLLYLQGYLDGLARKPGVYVARRGGL